MTFEEAVQELRSMIATEIELTVSGPGSDGESIVNLSGEIEEVTAPQELQSAVRNLGSPATTFRVGAGSENYLTLWPNRFVRADASPPTGVRLTTRDAVISVDAKGRPWID